MRLRSALYFSPSEVLSVYVAEFRWGYYTQEKVIWYLAPWPWDHCMLAIKIKLVVNAYQIN